MIEAQVGLLHPQSKHILFAWAERSLLNICVMSDFEGPDIFTKSHEVCSENISSEVSLAELATFTYIYKAKLLTVSTDGVVQ